MFAATAADVTQVIIDGRVVVGQAGNQEIGHQEIGNQEIGRELADAIERVWSR